VAVAEAAPELAPAAPVVAPVTAPARKPSRRVAKPKPTDAAKSTEAAKWNRNSLFPK